MPTSKGVLQLGDVEIEVESWSIEVHRGGETIAPPDAVDLLQREVTTVLQGRREVQGTVELQIVQAIEAPFGGGPGEPSVTRRRRRR